MSQQELKASFLSQLGAEDVGLGSFLRTFVDWLRSLASQAIDTEEERDRIVDVAMSVADKVVAVRFSAALWVMIRPSVRELLDEAIDSLPGLIG